MGNLHNRSVFAIRVGDFVELRAGFVPPVAKISKLTKTITEKRGGFIYDDQDSWVGRYVEKDVKRKIVLKQVFFVGGTVLCYTKHSTFVRLFKKTIPKDKLIQLKPEWAMNVLKSSWRRKNL